MKYIEIKNLSKQYNEAAGIYDVNASIEQGSFTSIVGPFGSGKTTLLRILGGLTKDYFGSVVINEMTPRTALSLDKIGYGFQQPTLLGWRNVLQNITLPQELKNQRDEGYAEALLDMVGLKHTESWHIDELSGGMRQLVSIVRSLALKPDLLLLDEPFSSIDEMSKDKMNEKLLAIHRESGMTTIMVTHSLQEAVYLSDRVIVLTKGPGTVKSIVDINIPRRSIADKYSLKANEYAKRLRKELEII